MQLLATYNDPAKRRLQRIELTVLAVLIPALLFWGGRAMLAYRHFRQARAYFAQGHELVHAHRYAEALAVYRKAVKTYPYLRAGWEELGALEYFRHHPRAELAAYRQGLHWLPNDGLLLRDEALAYRDLREPVPELAVLRRAIKRLPHDPLTRMLYQRALKQAAAGRKGSVTGRAARAPSAPARPAAAFAGVAPAPARRLDPPAPSPALPQHPRIGGR